MKGRIRLPDAQGCLDCSKCGAHKPVEQFPLDHRYSCGRHSRCTACKNTRRAELYWSRKDEELARMRAYRRECGDVLARKARRYRAAHVEDVRRWTQQQLARRREVVHAAVIPTTLDAVAGWYGIDPSRLGLHREARRIAVWLLCGQSRLSVEDAAAVLGVDAPQAERDRAWVRRYRFREEVKKAIRVCWAEVRMARERALAGMRPQPEAERAPTPIERYWQKRERQRQEVTA